MNATEKNIAETDAGECPEASALCSECHGAEVFDHLRDEMK